MSWDSMKGRFRSCSCGGNGPQSGLLLSRTPVYMIVGVPSESAMQHPAQRQACTINSLRSAGPELREDAFPKRIHERSTPFPLFND